jgi:hypothetical protein
MNKRKVTIAPVEPGDTSNVAPEWGRIRDVERLFGIKRGTTYALIKSRRIRSCLLRAQGRVSGLRLIHLDSVRNFISSEMKNTEQQLAE